MYYQQSLQKHIIKHLLNIIFKNKKKNSTKNENNNLAENSNSKEIKLLHKKTGEVENVKLEEYLCNVVSAEKCQQHLKKKP